MNAMDSQMIAGVVVVALIVVAAYLLYRKSQSDRLAHRFGPEYGRVVEELGSREKAETELMTREKRVGSLKIVPLNPEDAVKFGQAWRGLQAKFVDDPRGAVAEADQLVRELLLKRGYPMTDSSAERPTFRWITRKSSTTTVPRRQLPSVTAQITQAPRNCEGR
jgi:hypothetical protein